MLARARAVEEGTCTIRGEAGKPQCDSTPTSNNILFKIKFLYSNEFTNKATTLASLEKLLASPKRHTAR